MCVQLQKLWCIGPSHGWQKCGIGRPKHNRGHKLGIYPTSHWDILCKLTYSSLANEKRVCSPARHTYDITLELRVTRLINSSVTEVLALWLGSQWKRPHLLFIHFFLHIVYTGTRVNVEVMYPSVGRGRHWIESIHKSSYIRFSLNKWFNGNIFGGIFNHWLTRHVKS